MAKSDPQMRVRLPNDCKDFVKRRADTDACSQNSVVVRAVRAMMDRENETGRLLTQPTGPKAKTTSPAKENDHGKRRQ